MKRIENNFCDYYYLTEDGTLFNSMNSRYKKADKQHKFILNTLDGDKKRITLKSLYLLVYNRPYCEDDIIDLENEVWKVIDNTNGLYYVSNMGRIKSYKGYKAIIMKPYKTKNGYDRVDIIQDGIRVSKLVHRLVAFAFLPIRSNVDMELHHKDFNKENNTLYNLVWLPKEEHIKKHIERKRENA